jgi:plasmid stabilization system protein ParE
MASIELSHAAVEDLERLIRTHSLPADTKQRVKRSLRSLETFPLIGAPLHGRWEGFRFLLGPWRWMLIVYEYFEDEKRVVVATIQDGRSARAAELTEADAIGLAVEAQHRTRKR